MSSHFPIQRVRMMICFLLELLDVPSKYLLCRGEILDSTFSCVRNRAAGLPAIARKREELDTEFSLVGVVN